MGFNLNMTAMNGMTPAQLTSYVHANVAVPELIFMFSVIFAIIALVGMFTIHGKQSKMKFLGILGISLVICIIILTGFILLPNTIEGIIGGLQ